MPKLRQLNGSPYPPLASIEGSEGPSASAGVKYQGFTAGPSRRAGEVLGDRFRILGFMTAGGTSKIYLAEDLNEKRPVIVKSLLPQAAKDPRVKMRFLAEAAAALSIDHPNVIRVLKIERWDWESPYLVLEALSGEPLGDYLRREESLPIELALRLARQAAAGLAAAHSAGVIHRDVKPDNLFLIGKAGDPQLLKVIDFGMARIAKNSKSSNSKIVLGTAQYMAPEQIVADPVDARTDVYALGVVLFRMLTGHLPFDADPRHDLLSHQLYSPAPPPSWLCDDLDPRVEQIVLRAMRKHPENRYQDMHELMRDLDAVLENPDEKALEAPSLRHEPDAYTPQNPLGRDAAAFLAAKFGAYATPPPPPAEQVD